jgi:hypothetical protein
LAVKRRRFEVIPFSDQRTASVVPEPVTVPALLERGDDDPLGADRKPAEQAKAD